MLKCHLLIILFFLTTAISFAQFQDYVADHEQLTYSVYDGTRTIHTTENIILITTNDVQMHQISLVASDGGTAKVLLYKGTLAPYLLSYYDEWAELSKQVRYTHDKIQVFIRNKRISYEVEQNRKDYWEMNSFFHVFRGYPFEKKEILFWGFLPEIKRSFLLFLKPIAEETLSFNGEDVLCVKLELGAAGFIESILFPQVFNFWIEKAPPHRFCRFYTRDFTGKEQITILTSYKVFAEN